MPEDLKIIKNKYGEKMMHLCREMFPTILEQPLVLSKILLDHFEPTRFLYDDIVNEEIEDEFKSYIYQIFDSNFREEKINEGKTPFELLDEAGYTLYECKTEEDIQNFKKYYSKGEELCTFNGDRLKRCYVFFAVKKDVDEIRREDFPNPERQDKYGTSVISIQFTKDDSHILSIKNRYNHTVPNPDATFSNNLDNIIEGLTESFEKEYGLYQKYKNRWNLLGYVLANDGKYYKYNYEINNIYYCPNNIIIDNFEVKRYPQEKYIVMDYYILDLKTGEITLYGDNNNADAFTTSIKDFDRVEIYKENELKKVIFKLKGEKTAVIVLNNKNNIIGLEILNLKVIGNNFLHENSTLQKINLPNVKKIGDSFLYSVDGLRELNMPNLTEVGQSFLRYDHKMKRLELPNIEKIGSYFMAKNEDLSSVYMPKLKYLGSYFLNSNNKLTKLSLPELKLVEHGFLYYNVLLEILELPNIEKIGNDFLLNNKKIFAIILPKVRNIGSNFLAGNINLICISAPELEMIGRNFLRSSNLKKLILPDLEQAGDDYICRNGVRINSRIIGKGKIK